MAHFDLLSLQTDVFANETKSFINLILGPVFISLSHILYL